MDDENEAMQESTNQPSDLTQQARRPKNKLKDAGKKVAGNLKDAFKNGLKGLWKALPLKGKIIVASIVAVIVFIACIYVVYADYFISASEDTISTYYESNENASQKGKTLYDSKGSLLFATNDDIKAIANQFFEDVKPRNNTLYEFMSKEYKSGDPENSGVPLKESFFAADALNINSSKTLYEHLLNAERYNFNKIKWIKYERNEDKGMIPLSEMQVEPTAQLQYPKDNENTSIDTLANMVRPYLQSWIIPYGLFSGLLSEGTGDEDKLDYAQFAYQVLINGYHEIVMNQYNLDVLTEVTTQNVYDTLEYTVKRTCSRDSEGNETVITAYVINADGKEYEVTESCKVEEVNKKSTPSKKIEYYLESAKTFDRIFENTYIVHLYNKETDTPKRSMVRTPYSTGNQLTQTEINALSNFSFSNKAGLLSYETGQSNSWSGTYTYTIKKGYTQEDTMVWEDKVETISENDRVLKVLDVEQYIDPKGEGKVKLSSEEKSYYEDLAVEENVESVRLTRMDVINAKKDIYSNYLKSGTNYSDNIGYPRSWLVFSLDALKKHAKSVESSEKGWNYLYGASLGVDIKINKTSASNVSGAYATLTDYDATGVFKAMQDAYAQYDLTDNRGYTYETIPVYPSSADYAWEHWKDYVTEVSENYSVDPKFPLFVLSKMCMESGGGQSGGWMEGKAAAGPMQIEKSVHLNHSISAYNVKTGQTDTIVMTKDALSDDKTNIKIGIMMYANHLNSCNGNPYLAAQKYNYGNILFVDDYAERVSKDKNAIIADVEDVGWVYESMKYHNNKRAGDAFYAYKFAFYLDYLSKK